jgi:type I restriction enzyme S subunit
MGEVIMTDRPSFTNQQINTIVPNNSVEPSFLYYSLCPRKQELLALGAMAGVRTPILNKSAFSDLKVPLPPLPIQRRIAGILSAYDDLIENSQRRIKILEAMARALYRKWFVHLRFPGHESVPLVPSPLGEIPQGWAVKKLAAVAEVNRAQITPRTAPEALHYIDISSVSPGQIDSITTFAFADAPGRARRIIQHGDVLWSCVRPNRRSHAQVMHPEPNTIASTGFAVLSPMKVPFTFLYFATTTDDFVAFLTNNATGAAYPAITSKTFENADLVIPPPPLLREFGNLTSPMAEQVHGLQLQIQNLRRTRDLLLPRLLTGQIALETLPGLSAEEQDSCLN